MRELQRITRMVSVACALGTAACATEHHDIEALLASDTVSEGHARIAMMSGFAVAEDRAPDESLYLRVNGQPVVIDDGRGEPFPLATGYSGQLETALPVGPTLVELTDDQGDVRVRFDPISLREGHDYEFLMFGPLDGVVTRVFEDGASPPADGNVRFRVGNLMHSGTAGDVLDCTEWPDCLTRVADLPYGEFWEGEIAAGNEVVFDVGSGWNGVGTTAGGWTPFPCPANFHSIYPISENSWHEFDGPRGADGLRDHCAPAPSVD